jgi:asparagine synthase (glutamine-hydrolysing)
MSVQKVRELTAVLRMSVSDLLKGMDNAALLFSGGVDSATLAVLARKHCDLVLYALGNGEAHDIKSACGSADMLDLPLVEVRFTDHDVLESLRELVSTHGLREPRWATTFIAFNLLMKRVEESTVISGQGADELFGGYKKYARMLPHDARKAMAKDLRALVENESPMYRRIAKSYGKTLALPFLDGGVTGFAGQLETADVISLGGTKVILRDAARLLGVPECIAERPKKAMQYGSGVSASLRTVLKAQSRNLQDLMLSMA